MQFLFAWLATALRLVGRVDRLYAATRHYYFPDAARTSPLVRCAASQQQTEQQEKSSGPQKAQQRSEQDNQLDEQPHPELRRFIYFRGL